MSLTNHVTFQFFCSLFSSRLWIALLVLPFVSSLAGAVTPKSPSAQPPKYQSVAPSKPTKKPSKKPSCIVVRPGVSLGPVRLGMTEKQLKALKLGLEYTSGRYKAVANVGPYRVVFQEKKGKSVVSIIQYELNKNASCFQVGRVRIDPSRTVEGMASQLLSCKPMEMRTGGNNIKCFDDGLWLLFKAYRATVWRSLHIQAIVPVSTAEVECFGYLVPGSYFSTATRDIYAKAGKPLRVLVRPNANYCVHSKHINTTTTPKEIPSLFPGECSQHKLRQGTAVYCNHAGLLFLFDAKQRLQGWKMFHVTYQKPLPSFGIMLKKYPKLTQLPSPSQTKPQQKSSATRLDRKTPKTKKSNI